MKRLRNFKTQILFQFVPYVSFISVSKLVQLKVTYHLRSRPRKFEIQNSYLYCMAGVLICIIALCHKKAFQNFMRQYAINSNLVEHVILVRCHNKLNNKTCCNQEYLNDFLQISTRSFYILPLNQECLKSLVRFGHSPQGSTAYTQHFSRLFTC